MTRILLSGGGNAEQTATLDAFFVRKLDISKPLLFIPHAWPGNHADSLAWLQEKLGRHGWRGIELAQDLTAFRYPDLEKYSGIYIGGGNTWTLLAKLRESGFIDVLRLYIERNGLVYGSSAGALILGKDIGASHDKNELGLSNPLGLNALHGYSVWCHYTLSHLIEVRALQKATRNPLIALPDESGVYVEDKTLLVIGEKPAHVIDKKGERTVQVMTRIL